MIEDSVRIVARGPFVLVGLLVRARWSHLWAEVPEAWSQLFARCEEIPHRVGVGFVDASLEKRGEEYTQLVCSEVSRLVSVPEGMRAIEIPRQEYAYLRHVGPARGIAESFGAIYDWARERPGTLGDFKLDFGYTAAGGENEHDLFVATANRSRWRALDTP